MRRLAFAILLLGGPGCSGLDLDASPSLIHARFDPDARVIPMPTDVLRDAAAGHLDIPNDTDADRAKLTPAESEFYNYLETLDGWSSLMSATVDFTGAIDPTSIDDATVQVWHWGAVPERVADVRISVRPDGKTDPRSIRRAPAGNAASATSRSCAAAATGVEGARRRARRVRRRVLLPAPDHAPRHARARARVPRRYPGRAPGQRDRGSRGSARTSRRPSTASRPRASRATRSPRCGRSR